MTREPLPDAELPNAQLPNLECDLILKGGITSGVVYPGVVSELRKTYRFRSVGGTSAGAIAAAATAAAEVGRQTGRGGFEKLETLPEWLGMTGEEGRSHLAGLFAPDPVVAPVHRALRAALGGGHPVARALRVAAAFPLALALGLLPGALLAALALSGGAGLLPAASAVAGLALVGVGGLLGVLLALYRSSEAALRENYLGLATGHDRTGRARGLRLTDWLSEFLDELAGVAGREQPLTFGDLEAQGVALHVITTSVTHGRPYGLPFPEVEPGKPGRFFLKREDVRAFFPDKVAAWLERHGEDAEHRGYLRLPAARDLPVVVATRLSLSFPLLISAVPLYAVDYTRARPEDRRLERCWFTDGGISSNFPVHLFDAPLPTRPTFAVNLRPHHVDYGPGSRAFARNRGVWMPNRNGDGTLAWWHRFERPNGALSFLAFLKAMVEAGLNWQDTLLASAPGYRDRIVHIGLGAEEGGLNLDMAPATLRALFERGRVAGRELVSRFALGEHDLDWDNHRWLRYRALMAALEEMHAKLGAAYRAERVGERSYHDLLTRAAGEPPRSYPFARPAQQTVAEELTRELLELAATWADSEPKLQAGSPRPAPKMKVAPEV